jgi:transglutaminase-like putative cysteine protease
LEVFPPVPVEVHEDYFHNHVQSLSVPFHHTELTIKAHATVQTRSAPAHLPGFEVTVAEAQQIFGSGRIEHYDFKAASPLVPTGGAFFSLARHLLAGHKPLDVALQELTSYIHHEFLYTPGITHVGTSALDALSLRQGVCQDFAHLMLAVLRTARLPSRYVSGYIETAQAKEAAEAGLPDLIGSAATHAWVEILLPGQVWVGFDPTNNIPASDRHIVVAVGRDYNDVTPLRGSYRGPGFAELLVDVRVERQTDTLRFGTL